MPVEIRYSGQTVTVQSPPEGTVEAFSPSFSVNVSSEVLGGGGPPYLGPYEATPTPDEQVMRTRSRTMRMDFTVHAIPYQEVSNESGGLTASIAS